MDGFLFCLGYLSITGEGILHIFFVGRFTKKNPDWKSYLSYLFSLYVIQGVALALHAGHLTVLWELLPLYLISRFALKNRRPDACIAAVLAVYIAQLSTGVMNAVEILLFPKVSPSMLLMYVLVILGELFALALRMCCFLLVVRWFSLAEGEKSAIWILLPPGLFLFAAELYILETSYNGVGLDSIEPGKQAALLALQLLSLSTLLSALYAWRRICRSFQAQAAIALLKQETQAQKMYVAEAKMRDEQTKSFRHDIQNHLSVLDGLLKSQKIYQAQEYLQKLEATANALSFPWHTGNPVVDILLGEKENLARSRGIQIEVSLILPQPCGVEDLDFCIIFSNAMDNAIRAGTADKQEDSLCREMFIRITGERQGDFYLLTFENTCLSQPRREIGIGLSNVRAVAERYNGTMEIEIKSEAGGFLFRLYVLLDISIHADDRSSQKPCNLRREV